jgi:transcriptional regulator with XRE-family HTH domain
LIFFSFFLCYALKLDNININGYTIDKRFIMGMTERIRFLLVKRGNLSEAELARRVGETPQNFNRKMKRDNFSDHDLRKIAEALDCTYAATFKLNDTGEEF